MLLVLHICFAVLTFALMGFAAAGKLLYRHRNFDKFAALSGLSFGGLFATGVGLVVEYHTSLTSACLSGLAYFSVLSLLYFAYRQIRASTEK